MNGWLRMISNFNRINTLRYSFVIIIHFLFFYTPLMAVPTTIVFEGGSRIVPFRTSVSPEGIAGLLENDDLTLHYVPATIRELSTLSAVYCWS